MKVLILKIRLRFLAAHSLKEKRSALTKIKERCAHKFKLAVAEVGGEELHNYAEIGLAEVSNDERYLTELPRHILSFIELMFLAEIVGEHHEIVSCKEW